MGKLTDAIEAYRAHFAECLLAEGSNHRKVCRAGQELDAAMYDAATLIEAEESRVTR